MASQQRQAHSNGHGSRAGQAGRREDAVHGEEQQRQPAGHREKAGQLQPGDDEAGEHEGDAAEHGGRPRESQRAQPEIGQETRQRQVDGGEEGHSAGDRQAGGKVEQQQVERIEDGRLAVGQERRAAELMRVPEREDAPAHPMGRERAPWVELRDGVPEDRVPGLLGPCGRRPGGSFPRPWRHPHQEVSGQEGTVAEKDRRQKKDGQGDKQEQWERGDQWIREQG